MLYVLKSGRHSRIEGQHPDGKNIRKLYRPGALINLNRKEALALGDRVTPHAPHIDDPVDPLEVAAAAADAAPPEPEAPKAPPQSLRHEIQDAPAGDSPPADDEGDDEDTGEVEDSFGTLDMTVPDVEELVSAMEDAADLRAIYAVEEQSTKPRIGVFNAVRSRIATLSDPDDQGTPDDGEE